MLLKSRPKNGASNFLQMVVEVRRNVAPARPDRGTTQLRGCGSFLSRIRGPYGSATGSRSRVGKGWVRMKLKIESKIKLISV